MSAGLFESPPRSESRPAAAPGAGDGYRSLSGVALAAAALAAFAPLALVDWWLTVVPTLAIVLGTVALRDIHRRPLELTGRPLALVALVASLTALATSVASHAYEYATELPDGFVRLSYAELQPAEGEPPTSVPESALQMDGRDVLLKGYIYPGKQQHGLVQFLLVRDQGDCCFGGNPKITDRVLVNLDAAEGIDFSQHLVKIAGRFRIEPVGFAAGAEGGVLYHLDAARVR